MLQKIAVVPAQWQDWGEWSECTSTCGEGIKMRARACHDLESGSNPVCPGNSTEIKECEETECPGKKRCPSDLFEDFSAVVPAQWQDWGEWSECTATCGKGLKTRARACFDPELGSNQVCPGSSTEVMECNEEECPGNSLIKHCRENNRPKALSLQFKLN